MAKTRHNQN